MRQARKHCPECGKKTLHVKPAFSGGLGCVLSILSLGLFIPIWLLIDLCNMTGKWTCQTCGNGRIV